MIPNFGECYIKENFGILCPSCGITRGTEALLNFNFILAIKYNAYFTLILFPIFLILFVDDIICMIIKKKSFVEIILRRIGRMIKRDEKNNNYYILYSNYMFLWNFDKIKKRT